MPLSRYSIKGLLSRTLAVGSSGGFKASQPPTHFRLIVRVLAAEQFAEGTLLGCDLEPLNIQDVDDRPKQRPHRRQEYCPGDENTQETDVHGIARDSVDARTNQRRGLFRSGRIDRCSRSPKRQESRSAEADTDQ